MAIKAVLTFLATASVFVIFGGLILIGFNASRGRRIQPGIAVAVAGFIAFAIISPLNAGLNLIQPQEVGVVFRQLGAGTNDGEANLLTPLSPGLRWVIPFVDQVEIYSTAQRTVTMAGGAEATNQVGTLSAVRAISNDGQVINLDVSVIYRIDATQINTIHQDWRQTFQDSYIVPQTRSVVRNGVSNFGAEDIYSGGRAQLEQDILQDMTERLAREGFILNDVLIRNIEFSQEFTTAIEDKQIAEQQAQQAVFRVQQAEQEAQQRRVQAQGEADAVVIAAEGDAQAIVIRAEAEAEGLGVINDVLSQNPNLIQWQYINELSDQVNLLVVPSDTPFLFDADSFVQPNELPQSSEPVPAPTSSTDSEESAE